MDSSINFGFLVFEDDLTDVVEDWIDKETNESVCYFDWLLANFGALAVADIFMPRFWSDPTDIGIIIAAGRLIGKDADC